MRIEHTSGATQLSPSVETACGVWARNRAKMSTSDEFREKAEECRLQSEKAASPRDKAVWLRIAESWLKLAQEVDDRPPRRKQ